MAFSDTWLSAGAVGAGLQGLSFFVLIGFVLWTWYSQGDKKLKGVFQIAQNTRRQMFNVGVLISPFLLMFMYIGLVVNDKLVWGLRITQSLGLATECSESLANQGVCGTYILQIVHSVVVLINCFMTAMFLRWKMYSAIFAFFGAGLVGLGLTAFEVFGDGTVRWVFLAVATVGWLFILSIHIISGVESWMNNGGPIESGKQYEDTRRKSPIPFIPDETKPDSQGRFVNSVNYPPYVKDVPYTTGEAVWNILFGIILNYSMLLILFAFLSPQGKSQYTMGTYLYVIVAVDFLHFFIGSIWRLNYWNMKSDKEIYSYGKKIGGKRP